MRLKPVPEPPADLETLAAFQRAIPLVPGSVDDCCARLRDRRGLSDRRAANDWIAFLHTLGLVRETPRGFVRTDADPTPELVYNGLRDGVFLVPETITRLAAASTVEPVTPESLFAATRESVPRHDRARDPNWEETWHDRADRLLRWLALVDAAVPLPTDGVDVEPRYVAGEAVSPA